MLNKNHLLGATAGALLLATVGALIPVTSLDPARPATPLVADAADGDDPPSGPGVGTAPGTDAGDIMARIDAGVEHLLELARTAVDELAVDGPVSASDETAGQPERQGPGRRKSKPSTKRKLRLVKTITGRGLSPKSIVADQNGQVFTMNMMYNHNITVFDRKYKRKKVIDDSIDLSKFGFGQFRSKVRGAPVEAAVAPDGDHVYVANYTMYGPGFPNQGFDLCVPGDRIDRGFVYEIDTRTLRKTDAIQVGEVPKYLAITPDGRYMLVGNWCSWDISVVDLRRNEEIKRIKAGVAPRGIAYSPNSKTAYVTLVGEHRVLVIDMDTFTVKRDITGLGKRPRHLVMSPNGRHLYITVQGEDRPGRADGRILKYDTRKRKVVARSRPLVEPRTTVAADDGKSLYVVDYHPGTLVKLKASDLSTLDSKYLGYHPIGVTYDDDSDKVWVAGYGGSVWVLKDK